MGHLATKPDLLHKEGCILKVYEEYGAADSALQDSEPSNLTPVKHFQAHVSKMFYYLSMYL